MGRDSHRTSDILEAVALLVVDMQDGFLKVIPDAGTVVARCAFAIEAARAFGIRVVFTEQAPGKLGPTHPGLLAAAGPDARVFAKHSFSALAAEGLSQHLKKLGVYHVLVAGIETPVCVYQTALHATDSELDVTILSDCVSGRRIHDCEVALRALAAAHCHVLSAETVFYSMLGGSENRHFADLTRLVKQYGDPGFVVPRPTLAPRPPPEEAVRESPPPEPARESEAGEALDERDPEELDETPGDEAPEPRDGDAAADGEPRKRPRRRRGGARRRRARERAEGAPGDAPPAPETPDEPPGPA